MNVFRKMMTRPRSIGVRIALTNDGRLSFFASVLVTEPRVAAIMP